MNRKYEKMKPSGWMLEHLITKDAKCCEGHQY